MKRKDTQLMGLALLIIGVIILLLSASPVLIPLIGIVVGLALIMMALQILGYPSLNMLINKFLNQFYSLFNDKNKRQ